MTVVDGKRQERSQQGPDVDTSTRSTSPEPCGSAVVAAQRCIVPVTSLTIAKVMSKDDAHYAPHQENPFPSRFRNAATKLISSNGNAAELLSPCYDDDTPPPTPVTPQEMTGSPVWTWKSYSLPGSSLVSRDGSRVFGLVDVSANEDGHCSSADSAVEFDVGDESCAASGLFVERLGRKSHNAEHAVMMVRCLEQLRVLLDDDGSSRTSVDEAVFSPTSSLSSRDDFTTDSSLPAVSIVGRPGPHERFRKLLARWEAGHEDVVLPARLRFADAHVVQRFSELRRMWESQQATSASSSAATGATVIATATVANGRRGGRETSSRRTDQPVDQQ